MTGNAVVWIVLGLAAVVLTVIAIYVNSLRNVRRDREDV
jgi:hypothetical protein